MSIFETRKSFEEAFSLFLSQKVHLLPPEEGKFLISTSCMSPGRRVQYGHLENLINIIRERESWPQEKKTKYVTQLKKLQEFTRVMGWAEWYRKELSDLGLKTGLQTGGKGFSLT
jgi:hypothetical protein